MQDVGQPSFERVTPKSAEDLKESDDVFLEDEDLKALKLSIHQKNIDAQKRLIENGFGSAMNEPQCATPKRLRLNPLTLKVTHGISHLLRLPISY